MSELFDGFELDVAKIVKKKEEILRIQMIV